MFCTLKHARICTIFEFDIVTLAGFVKSQQSIKCPLRLQVFRGQKRQMKCHVTPENPNTIDYNPTKSLVRLQFGSLLRIN